MAKNRRRGKFWPRVRPLIWEKAQELYQMENAKTYRAEKPLARKERLTLNRRRGYAQIWKYLKGLRHTFTEKLESKFNNIHKLNQMMQGV